MLKRLDISGIVEEASELLSWQKKFPKSTEQKGAISCGQ